MFDLATRDGVLRARAPGTRWLSTGWDGGFARADAAYNVSVPDGWERTDLEAYLDERRAAAGFDAPGPALLTGVDLRHARGARTEPAVAVATAGVSNPAALSMAPSGSVEAPATPPDAGTVNLLVGVDRALPDGALADLVAVAAEAKTATLLHETGFPGTTTDAVVVGCDPDGSAATFAGSGTETGTAVRACVRDAVRASLRSRYGASDAEIPASVADAEHGVTTGGQATVFEP